MIKLFEEFNIFRKKKIDPYEGLSKIETFKKFRN